MPANHAARRRRRTPASRATAAATSAPPLPESTPGAALQPPSLVDVLVLPSGVAGVAPPGFGSKSEGDVQRMAPQSTVTSIEAGAGESATPAMFAETVTLTVRFSRWSTPFSTQTPPVCALKVTAELPRGTAYETTGDGLSLTLIFMTETGKKARSPGDASRTISSIPVGGVVGRTVRAPTLAGNGTGAVRTSAVWLVVSGCPVEQATLVATVCRCRSSSRKLGSPFARRSVM